MIEILNALGLGAGDAATLAVIVLSCRFFAKLIPDSATGWLGYLRIILKIIGAYTENKK